MLYLGNRRMYMITLTPVAYAMYLGAENQIKLQLTRSFIPHTEYVILSPNRKSVL